MEQTSGYHFRIHNGFLQATTVSRHREGCLLSQCFYNHSFIASRLTTVTKRRLIVMSMQPSTVTLVSPRDRRYQALGTIFKWHVLLELRGSLESGPLHRYAARGVVQT